MRKLLRLIARSLWLAAMMAIAIAEGFWIALINGFDPALSERTSWLHRHSRRVLRVFVSRVEAAGSPPKSGLLVCNHLSYLDILLLASLTPAVFVSKHEVRHWPVLGWLARLAGTIFVRRERRGDVGQITQAIRGVLHQGQLVALFPEGTTSNGKQVLPFKSSLLEPATGGDPELFAGHIGYAVSEGSVENDVCYWGDMTFFPHAMKLLTKPRVVARVRFSRVQSRNNDRKALARDLHAEVLRLEALSRDE